MHHNMLRLSLSALVATVVAMLSLASASAAVVKPDSCPTDKPLVVDSYATVVNTFDYGADGHVWALDTGSHSIEMWQLGGNAYCIKIHDVGTSVTFAGLSPEGTGTVRAGVIASFVGTIYARIYGTFAPKVATSGSLGTFDLQCNQDGTCASPYPDPTNLYFSSVQNIVGGTFDFTADAGACGTWSQSAKGDTGDIVC